MGYEFRPGDQVLYNGDVYEVMEKRMGLDFYMIGKPMRNKEHSWFGSVRNGLYADQLTLVTDATIENARDIEQELRETRKED